MLDNSNCVRLVVFHTSMSQEVVVIMLNTFIIIIIIIIILFIITIISAHLNLVPKLRMIGTVPPLPCMP